MATAGDVIGDSLKRILVEGADAAPEADEYADGLTLLNDYMASLEARGIRLGFTPVTGTTDNVTIPDGALTGLKSNLAIYFSPQFGGSVSPELNREARYGMRALRRLGKAKIRTSLPETLPRGAGTNSNLRTSRYYTFNSTGLLTLAGNAQATTVTTADTPVLVNGFWTVERLERLDGDITGRFTSIVDENVSVTAKVTLKATGDGAYTFRIMVNGQSQASSTVTLSTTQATVTISKALTLSPGTYIEVWVEGDGHTNNLTVADAQFRVT